MKQSINQSSRAHHFSVPMMILLAATFAACGPRGTAFRIEGHIPEMTSGELYIYNLSEDNPRIDTIQVKNGKWVYAGHTSDPEPYMLVFPNAMEQVIFAEGGTTLHYKANMNDLKNYEVTGSEENELMNAFRRASKDLNETKMPSAAHSFIEQYPTTMSAIYIFDRYILQQQNVDAGEAETLLSMLRSSHPDNRFLQEAEGELKNLNKGKIGSQLPKLTLKTKKGNTVKLASPDTESASGKAQTIMFWATWMPDSWRFSSELRRLANDYYYMSKIQLICISLDTEQYKWEEAVQGDSLSVNHVCDGRAWDTPIATALGIQEIPVYVMADKKGRIIARGTTFDALKQDIQANLIQHY